MAGGDRRKDVAEGSSATDYVTDVTDGSAGCVGGLSYSELGY
ncbi:MULTISPECIES: hypothetical protein [unclassified Microcoleus]|nr:MULTISPECIES: hypothetical protein [unclassified Microcoleus]